MQRLLLQFQHLVLEVVRAGENKRQYHYDTFRRYAAALLTGVRATCATCC